MKFTFIGCSFTVGEGLELEKSDSHNYTNIVGKYYSAEVKNLAIKGNSNYNIFLAALNELLFNSPDTIFIQWSALNRLWLYPSPDSKLTLSHTINADYNYRDIHYSKKELQKVSDIYHILNHDYNNLLTLINYCNILTKINSCRIVFINGLVPWTKEILDSTTEINFSKNLSEYSKEILEFNSRDDSELIEFFTKLNIAAKSLDQSNWVNMFKSMCAHQCDKGTDNAHPGIKSHKLYAEMIINYLEGNE